MYKLLQKLVYNLFLFSLTLTTHQPFFEVIESVVWNRRARSQSCPFCRGSLKRVNSGDLWIYTSSAEIADLPAIYKENLKRLLIYIDKLPLVTSDSNLAPYAPLPRWTNTFSLFLVLYIAISIKISSICVHFVYNIYVFPPLVLLVNLFSLLQSPSLIWVCI